MVSMRDNFREAKDNGKKCIVRLRNTTLKEAIILTLKPLKGIANDGRFYALSKKYIEESSVR